MGSASAHCLGHAARSLRRLGAACRAGNPSNDVPAAPRPSKAPLPDMPPIPLVRDPPKAPAAPPPPPNRPAYAGVTMASTVAALMPAMSCLVFIVDLLVTLAHRVVFASDTTGRGDFFPADGKKIPARRAASTRRPFMRPFTGVQPGSWDRSHIRRPAAHSHMSNPCQAGPDRPHPAP